MPKEIALEALKIQVTFDHDNSSQEIASHNLQLQEKLDELKIKYAKEQDYSYRLDLIEHEKKIIQLAAAQRLQEINQAQDVVSHALNTLKQLKINYSDLNDPQEINIRRKQHLMHIAALLDEISPALKKAYTTLNKTDELPELCMIITKKTSELNHLAKLQQAKIIDSLPLSEEEQMLHYRFTQEDIQVLIDRKKVKRPINCFVIDGSKPISVKNFLEQIRLNGQHRTQLIYKIDSTEHWSTVDIQRDVEGRLSVFFFDAIGHTTNLSEFVEYCLSYNCELTKSMGGLQKDYASCSTFSVDHAFHMSKIPDLHKQLYQVRTKDQKSDKTFNVDPLDLPIVLVKNAQSIEFIAKYLQKHEEHESTKINLKEQTLKGYTQLHLATVDKEQIAASITYKQSQYRKKVNRVKGYPTDPKHQEKVNERAKHVIEEAARAIATIDINFPSYTSAKSLALCYLSVLQHIDEIRTNRSVRDAQAVLNLKKPSQLTEAITFKTNALIQTVFKNGNQLSDLFKLPDSLLSTTQRTQILTVLQNHLGTIIQNGTQLRDLFILPENKLSAAQHKQIWSAIEGSIGTLIGNGGKLAGLFKLPEAQLSVVERIQIWVAVKDNLGKLIQNGDQLAVLFKLPLSKLSEQQRHHIWMAIKDQLGTLVRNAYDLNSLFSLSNNQLAPNLRSLIWDAVKNKPGMPLENPDKTKPLLKQASHTFFNAPVEQDQELQETTKSGFTTKIK
ncbi:MAG: hypothetical protein PSV35_02845 [bacterium]|nr:hypothetical protein [bacterium]